MLIEVPHAILKEMIVTNTGYNIYDLSLHHTVLLTFVKVCVRKQIFLLASNSHQTFSISGTAALYAKI